MDSHERRSDSADGNKILIITLFRNITFCSLNRDYFIFIVTITVLLMAIHFLFDFTSFSTWPFLFLGHNLQGAFG